MFGMYNVIICWVVVFVWIGNFIEYYDFLLYGLVSVLVFGLFFFSGVSLLIVMLFFFVSFGVGFIF